MRRPWAERFNAPTAVGLLLCERLFDQGFSGLLRQNASQLRRSPEPCQAIMQWTLHVGPGLEVRDERREVLAYLGRLGVAVGHRSNREGGERGAEKVRAGM